MKKNSFNRRPSERPLVVRILAIILILFMVGALIITMLPSIAFGMEVRLGGALRAEEEIPDITDLTKGSEGRPILVYDAADILTDAEEAELEQGLQSFREEQDFDIVVLTVYSLGGYDVGDYAERFYDYNGYGGGEEHDGAIILVSTEYRDWTMSTTGYGITAITDYSLDQIESEILPDLSAGNYADAFKGFADHCAYCVREARNGNIIDEYIEDEPAEGTSGRGEYPLAANAGIAGFIGIITSWFTNGRKKAALKSVRYRSQAKEYMRENSLKLTENRDRYLYTTVNRIPINRERDDNHHRPGNFGGSTIHMGSSGVPHGGGHSGKF